MTWTTRIVSASPTVDVRFDMTQGSQNTNGNYTNVNWSVQSITSGGTRTGTWDYNAYVNGSRRANGSNSSTHSGTQTLASGSYQVGHDANGNKTVSGSGWLDAYFGSGTASGSLTLSRIARAPYGLTQSVNSITTSTATVVLDISNRGHGTSATHRAEYKPTNQSNYTNSSNQSITDLNANNFNISGLTQNTEYHYRQRAWNNNNDTAVSSAGTFVTLAEVVSLESTDVQATSVTFVNIGVTQGHHTTNTKVQYRKKGDSTWLDSASKTGTGISIEVTGLLPSTTYERRFVCTTTAGTTTGSIAEFTTLPAAKLVMPDGSTINAIPRVIQTDGTTGMVKVRIIPNGS